MKLNERLKVVIFAELAVNLWLDQCNSMSQFNYIKDIAKYGLENDQEKLLSVLNELIDYSKKSKKLNFALQLQSILKDAIRHQRTNGLTKVGSDSYFHNALRS